MYEGENLKWGIPCDEHMSSAPNADIICQQDDSLTWDRCCADGHSICHVQVCEDPNAFNPDANFNDWQACDYGVSTILSYHDYDLCNYDDVQSIGDRCCSDNLT